MAKFEEYIAKTWEYLHVILCSCCFHTIEYIHFEYDNLQSSLSLFHKVVRKILTFHCNHFAGVSNKNISHFRDGHLQLLDIQKAFKMQNPFKM